MYASIVAMKRTTVYLSETTDLELTRLAHHDGRSKAELIRDALESYVEKKQEKKRTLPKWVGAGRSGIPDLAQRDEELLGQIYDEKYERIFGKPKP